MHTIYISGKSTSMYKLAAQSKCLLEKFRETRWPILSLSIPTKSVVIGRHQNCWKECKIEKIKKDNIDLVRRDTGGGAIYVDQGNLLFSFVHDNTRKISNNCNVIVNSINDNLLWEKAELAEKNNIYIEGKKVSKSIYTQTNNIVLHHGTIFISIDQYSIDKYLIPSKLKSENIMSNANRVVNLSDLYECVIQHDHIMNKIIQNYQCINGKANTIILDTNNDDMMNYYFNNYKKYVNDMQSSEFIYNDNPQFTHEIEGKSDFGAFQLVLNVEKNKITYTKYYSDGLDVNLTTAIDKCLADLLMYKDYCADTFAIIGEQIKQKEVQYVMQCAISKIKTE